MMGLAVNKDKRLDTKHQWNANDYNHDQDFRDPNLFWQESLLNISQRVCTWKTFIEEVVDHYRND
jgi:hypothetical protein